jgi:hypothetical protein
MQQLLVLLNPGTERSFWIGGHNGFWSADRFSGFLGWLTCPIRKAKKLRV